MPGERAMCTLVQCLCCNMKFFRRSSSIYGNSDIYYNRNHMLRYYRNNRIKRALSEAELEDKNYNTPSFTVVWMDDEPRPFRLISGVAPVPDQPFEQLTVGEIAIICLFLTRISVRMSLIKQILSESKPMTLYLHMRNLRRRGLITKQVNEYKLTSKGLNMLDHQFRKS